MARKAMHSTSAALGFRICGMQCFNRHTRTVKCFDKYFGQQVKLNAMVRTLALFFCGSDGAEPPHGDFRGLIEVLLTKLESLIAIVSHLPGRRFWGSSLLVCFDAALADEASSEGFLKSVRLKMIDFANSESVGGDHPDLEYLCGLQNLRLYLQSMLSPHALEGPRPEQLVSPPSPRQQDLEQERCREAMLSKFPSNPGAEPADETEHRNLQDNAVTVSGATGGTLRREVGSNLVREDSSKGLASARISALFK